MYSVCQPVPMNQGIPGTLSFTDRAVECSCEKSLISAIDQVSLSLEAVDNITQCFYEKQTSVLQV